MLKKFLRMFFRMFLETRDGEEALSITRVTFATFFWIIVGDLIAKGNIPSGAVTVFSVLLGAITTTKVAQVLTPYIPKPPAGDV